LRDGRLLFRFRGKGGAAHEIAVDDARWFGWCETATSSGQRLFQYVDEAGERRPIDSDGSTRISGSDGR
jgi:DNA topoisomerase IB